MKKVLSSINFSPVMQGIIISTPGFVLGTGAALIKLNIEK
jgi:hypothetical protein